MKKFLYVFCAMLVIIYVTCVSAENRYSVITTTFSPKGFARRDYSEREFAEIKTELSRIKDSIEKLVEKELGDVSVEYDLQELYLRIVFDKKDYKKNIRINIHDQNKLGFENIVPVKIINDSKLKINHFWFFYDECLLDLDLLEQRINLIYALE